MKSEKQYTESPQLAEKLIYKIIVLDWKDFAKDLAMTDFQNFSYRSFNNKVCVIQDAYSS